MSKKTTIKIVKKVIGFLFIYLVLFVGLTVLFLSINPGFPDNALIRRIIEILSMLTPVLINYGSGDFFGILSAQSFNPRFLILNIAYAYLIYMLIIWLASKLKKNKEKHERNY